MLSFAGVSIVGIFHCLSKMHISCVVHAVSVDACRWYMVFQLSAAVHYFSLL
jgi:hypothetical protein